MLSDRLKKQIIFESNDPLKIRNISVGIDFTKVNSLESLPGFATPFMSLHEDFSIAPFDIRFRYHNQNNTVGKIVVDIAQFLKKEPNTDALDETFNALNKFYENHFGEHQINNEECNYEDVVRHKWTGGENENISILLDLGFEDDGDRIKVLKLCIQLN